MSRNRTIAVLVVVIAVALGVVFFGRGNEKAVPDAKIAVVDRSVAVKDPESTAFKAPVSGSLVVEGTRVRTDEDGLATLTYDDGSFTRVGPDSIFTVEKLGHEVGASTITKLDVGQTWHRVNKVADGGSFEVKTGNAVAAVRGTAFGVSCLVATVCDISVGEGAVLVRSARGTQTVRAGRTIRVTGKGKLGAVKRTVPTPWILKNNQLDNGETTTTTGSSTSSTSSTSTSSTTAATAGGVTSTTRKVTATTRKVTTTTRRTNTTAKTTTTKKPTTTAAPTTAAPTTAAPTTAAPTTSPTTARPRQTTTDPSTHPTDPPASIGPPDLPDPNTASMLGGPPVWIVVIGAAIALVVGRRRSGWSD